MKRNVLGNILFLMNILHIALACLDTECPSSLKELDNLVASKNWTLSGYHYHAFVKPEYFQNYGASTNNSDAPASRNFTVEITSTIDVTLDKFIADSGPNAASIHIQLNCTIHHKTLINDPISLIQEDQNSNNNFSHLGYLYFEDLTLEPKSSQHYEIGRFLYVGDGALLSSRKSVFKFSVARPTSKNYTVISNMPLEQSEPIADLDGWVWDHFQESVPMYPTHASVYIIGGLVEKIEKKDGGRNKIVSIIWRPELATKLGVDVEKVRNTQICFALVAMKTLIFYEKLFGVQYPLSKLDVVVTSARSNTWFWNNYFGLGSIDMENYMYYATLDGPCENDRVQNMKPFLSALLAQWMDNIKFRTENNDMLLKFGLKDHFLHLAMDNVMGKRMGGVEVYLARIIQWMDIVDEGRDGLSGFKATALFKMLESLLTKPVFEEGIITNFMQKLGNGGDGQLEIRGIFDALQNAVESNNKTHLLPEGKMVKNVLENWMCTQGHPLIRVGVSSIHSNDSNIVLSISQETINANCQNGSEIGFWIPLQIVTDTETQFIWLPNTTKNVSVTLRSFQIKYVLVNPNIIGHYETLYDATLSQMLATQLVEDHQVVPPVMRMRLIQEYFEFAKKGVIGLASALEFTKYLTKEREPLVWYIVTTGINWRDWAKHYDYETSSKLQSYLNNIVETVMTEHYGFDTFRDKLVSENRISASDDLSRRELLRACIWQGNPGCIKLAKGLMRQWMENPEQDPFSDYKENDDLKCLALRGNFPRDGSGLLEFYIHKLGNKYDDKNGKPPCHLPNALESALMCTGNQSLILAELENVLEKVSAEETCYALLTPGFVATQYPKWARQVLQLAREPILTGRIKPDYVLYYIGDNGAQSDDFIADFEQFLTEFKETRIKIAIPDAVEKLSNVLEQLKEKNSNSQSECARNARAWLERNGY